MGSSPCARKKVCKACGKRVDPSSLKKCSHCTLATCAYCWEVISEEGYSGCKWCYDGRPADWEGWSSAEEAEQNSPQPEGAPVKRMRCQCDCPKGCKSMVQVTVGDEAAAICQDCIEGSCGCEGCLAWECLKDKRIYVSQKETEVVENEPPEVIEAAREEDRPACEPPKPQLSEEGRSLREPGPPAAHRSLRQRPDPGAAGASTAPHGARLPAAHSSLRRPAQAALRTHG